MYEGHFYVRRIVYLLKIVKVITYIVYMFGAIGLLSIHATQDCFKMYCFNDLQETKTYQYIGHWK